ncbi:DedA family protein [Cohnella zeiphila]|uniref:DedA family protein n=1 Tax=Cohnella zeiphila TaxID=2761120 RepID=A0A7X0VU28_9BACL|nr:DedA family protein [Cohnella zeiphila]MBB6730581.1 DedA family protein [Cohnella zeiphila]
MALYDQWAVWVGQFGCAALFFSLWLGLIGLPIPNEVVVVSGGALSGSGALPGGSAFLATYLGVACGLTFGYAMGRKLGPGLIDRLSRRRGVGTALRRSERLLGKHSDLALLFSYFIPVVRHLVPYGAGAGRTRYARFALLAYSSSLVWTAVFFSIGLAFGSHARDIGYSLYEHGIRVLWLAAVTAVCWAILRSRRRRAGSDGLL